jgi:hypothetical protein
MGEQAAVNPDDGGGVRDVGEVAQAQGRRWARRRTGTAVTAPASGRDDENPDSDEGYQTVQNCRSSSCAVTNRHDGRVLGVLGRAR